MNTTPPNPFTTARFAAHPDGRLATRSLDLDHHPWSVPRRDGAGYAAYSDEEMLREGWVPVIEQNEATTSMTGAWKRVARHHAFREPLFYGAYKGSFIDAVIARLDILTTAEAELAEIRKSESTGSRRERPMSEPYTPDEVELIDCYAHHLSEHAGEDYREAQADAERGIDRIKADALREAGNLEKLLDESIEANESLRARNEKLEQRILELSRLAQDAKAAPLTMDSLREAWEGAEVPTAADPIRKGDTLIRFDPEDGAVDAWECKTGYHPASGITRVLHRAPRREPWEDLADVLAVEMPSIVDAAGRLEALAGALYREHGVRVVTEGDESNE